MIVKYLVWCVKGRLKCCLTLEFWSYQDHSVSSWELCFCHFLFLHWVWKRCYSQHTGSSQRNRSNTQEHSDFTPSSDQSLASMQTLNRPQEHFQRVFPRTWKNTGKLPPVIYGSNRWNSVTSPNFHCSYIHLPHSLFKSMVHLQVCMPTSLCNKKYSQILLWLSVLNLNQYSVVERTKYM